MKNYYYNPKTQDLMIFDTSSNEIDVLEILRGIRVITSSEIKNGGGDEPVKHWKNSNWDSESGKAGYKGKVRATSTCSKCGKKGHRSDRCSQEQNTDSLLVKKGGKWKCKNCGEMGHSTKTCKRPARQAATTDDLPSKVVDAIVREERVEETIAP